MPGRDGTGPMGVGPKTGRVFGVCNGAGHSPGPGRGSACRRGFGRRLGTEAEGTSKQLLENQKTVLKKRLEAIDKELENQ